MYSSFIRIILAMVGLSPALFSLYIVKMSHDFGDLSFYIKGGSLNDIFGGLLNFVNTHGLLLLFATAILLARFIVRKAKRDLPIGRISLKSIKPGDINFFPVLFSVILPFYKIFNPSTADFVYIGGFILAALVYGIIVKSSYHFNLVLRLFLGYKHYEIATIGEVTYLLISKNKIINKNQVTEYVSLTDYMLINVTDRNK